jgi:hypothetical protein
MAVITYVSLLMFVSRSASYCLWSLLTLCRVESTGLPATVQETWGRGLQLWTRAQNEAVLPGDVSTGVGFLLNCTLVLPSTHTSNEHSPVTYVRFTQYLQATAAKLGAWGVAII